MAKKAIFARFSDQVMNSVSNKFRLDPQMSYVSADVKAMDPAFWAPPKKPTN